jgi:hypothetical protein
MRSVASRSTPSVPPSGEADDDDDDEAAVGEVDAEAEAPAAASSDESRSGLERLLNCFAPPPWNQ